MRFKDFINEDINMQGMAGAKPGIYTPGQAGAANAPQAGNPQASNPNSNTPPAAAPDPAKMKIDQNLKQIAQTANTMTDPLGKKTIMNATQDFQKLMQQPNNRQAQNSIANRTMNNQKFAFNMPNRPSNFNNQGNMGNMPANGLNGTNT